MSSVYVNPAAALFIRALTVLQIVLPVIIITIINITLMVVAYRKRRKHGRNTTANQKGYITILLVSGLLVCSLTPYVIFAFLKTKGIKVHPSLDLTTFHFLLINVGGNPVLYTMTNRRFGSYVMDLAKRFISCGMLAKNARKCSMQPGSPCSSGASALTTNTIPMKAIPTKIVEDKSLITMKRPAVQEI